MRVETFNSRYDIIDKNLLPEEIRMVKHKGASTKT